MKKQKLTVALTKALICFFKRKIWKNKLNNLKMIKILMT